ncbi:Protein LIAT1 [Channa argus]|uniref:Protein LIAT1 n=1 Tax=Channa argus TaxID=215402 RepID=A0A6G1QTQ7_CHAAH|nr:Protein LIAT1 [Channa argus]KAK2882068.1 hypothetical protein Q8A73_022578 [Channa argus]
MPEEKTCKLLQPLKKKTKKKKKKATASNTPTENAEKPQDTFLPPETSTVSIVAQQIPGQVPKFKATSKKNGEQLADSKKRRSKKCPKDSPSPVSHEALAQGHLTELSARESLRWEGALEDPQAEEKRLEMYRANRRQRYIAHREALSKEIRDPSQQTNKSSEKN